jgi:hypothetical protein
MARGEKTCPQCKTTTGPRAFNCPKCQYDYKVKKTVKKADKIEPELTPEFQELLTKGRKTEYNLIYAPGKNNYDKNHYCPFDLKNSEEKTVREWLDKIAEYVFDSSGNKSKYSRVAIEYFVGYFFPVYLKVVSNNKEISVIENPEYKKVIEIVRNNMEPYTKELLLGYK